MKNLDVTAVLMYLPYKLRNHPSQAGIGTKMTTSHDGEGSQHSTLSDLDHPMSSFRPLSLADQGPSDSFSC